MEEFSRNIEGIRRMMSELRNEKYAIVNPDLVSLDEYMKNLYLKVLCTVVQFGEEPTEMQVLFLKRIVAGIGVEDPAEEYMRKALEISGIDMQEFLTGMKENRAKYYFGLEGLILVSIGTVNQECYQYLAEIMELLDICKEDLRYICLVASSVLQQQPSFYDEAKALTNERIREVDYAPYIQNFYAGAIKDSVELVHYAAPDKKDSESVDFRSSYTERRVLFDNLNIDISTTWNFDHCEEVIFRNCNFSGHNFSIEMEYCEKVILYRCHFENFCVPVFKQKSIGFIHIEGCEFEKCIGKCAFQNEGCVIHIYDPYFYGFDTDESCITIRESTFRNCGGQVEGYKTVEGVILNARCAVNDCIFDNCHLHNGSGMSTLFVKGTSGLNNKLHNSIQFCE